MAKEQAAKVSVVTNDPPIDKEVLAEAIVRLGQEVSKLNNTRLNREAIVVLLNHYTKLPQRDIKTMLDAIPQLQKAYLK